MNKDSRSVRARAIADIAFFFTVLSAPWWFVTLTLFLGVWYFKNFYEAFFFGLLFDMLYGTNVAAAHGFRFFFSSGFLLLIFVVDFMKEKVRV